MRKIKAALVGAGGWGSTHISNWLRLAREGVVEFAGVSDINPKNLEAPELAGIPHFTSDSEMYDAVHPDAVSIAAGIPVHLALLRNALAHGVSVLLEKPAAATGDEVEAMIFESQLHPANFALIAFQYLYAPETHRLKELTVSGKYGHLRSISVRCAVKRDDVYYARNRWAGKISGHDGKPVFDSPLSNAFAHYLNLALFLAGPEMPLCASAESFADVHLIRARREIENFDSCFFRARTRENIPIDVFMTHTVEKPEWPNLRIRLEKAEIVWSPSDWVLLGADGATVLERAAYEEDPQYHMFRTAAALAAGEPGPSAGVCTIQTALEHTRCVEQIQKYPIRVLAEGEYVRREDGGGFYTVPGLEKILGMA